MWRVSVGVGVKDTARQEQPSNCGVEESRTKPSSIPETNRSVCTSSTIYGYMLESKHGCGGPFQASVRWYQENIETPARLRKDSSELTSASAEGAEGPRYGEYRG